MTLPDADNPLWYLVFRYFGSTISEAQKHPLYPRFISYLNSHPNITLVELDDYIFNYRYLNEGALTQTPQPSPQEEIILIGEIYNKGILVSSGSIKKIDLDKLLAIQGYTFIETSNPKPAPSEGANPFKGGYDPITHIGQPFIRDAKGNKIYLVSPSDEVSIQDTITPNIIEGSKILVLEP